MIGISAFLKNEYLAIYGAGRQIKVQGAKETLEQLQNETRNQLIMKARTPEPLYQPSTIAESKTSMVGASTTFFCRYCGASLPSDTVFCEKCGKKIK
jgi:hypothetical protein